MEYNFREIEPKWQKYWVEHQTYKVVENKEKEKFYVLNMFPYQWCRTSCRTSARLHCFGYLRTLQTSARI